jgi:hypothetical protein
VMTYRTDVLVLVVDDRGLDREKLKTKKPFALVDLESVLRSHEGRTQRYLEALRMAVKRDESSPAAVPAGELFKVRAFLLFVNSRRPDEEIRQLVNHNELFQSLAMELGSKFGAKPRNCFAFAASATDQPNARNLIVNLYRLRDMLPAHKAVLGRMAENNHKAENDKGQQLMPSPT